MTSTALALADLLGEEGEVRASKYVDAGCSMPVVSFLSFVLITGVTVVNVIQVGVSSECSNDLCFATLAMSLSERQQQSERRQQ
jgi:ABC-type anion transport system duplicated permease subunit